jgi:hypothetical protein
VLVKLLLGMAVTLAGAAGVETLTNFTVPGSAYGMLQVLAEEMAELLGATIVLWGSYDLLAEHRFALKLDRVQTEGS